MYEPCKGIYLVLMYNIKSNQKFVVANIASHILAALNNSALVVKNINKYQHSNLLPMYCKSLVDSCTYSFT